MYKYMRTWIKLKSDTHAVTALEYGLIAAVVGSVIAVGFGVYGTAMKTALSGLTV